MPPKAGTCTVISATLQVNQLINYPALSRIYDTCQTNNRVQPTREARITDGLPPSIYLSPLLSYHSSQVRGVRGVCITVSIIHIYIYYMAMIVRYDTWAAVANGSVADSMPAVFRT